jgi:hypothetical protein
MCEHSTAYAQRTQYNLSDFDPLNVPAVRLNTHGRSTIIRYGRFSVVEYCCIPDSLSTIKSVVFSCLHKKYVIYFVGYGTRIATPIPS